VNALMIIASTAADAEIDHPHRQPAEAQFAAAPAETPRTQRIVLDVEEASPAMSDVVTYRVEMWLSHLSMWRPLTGGMPDGDARWMLSNLRAKYPDCRLRAFEITYRAMPW
jgi:hypothetical protein